MRTGARLMEECWQQSLCEDQGEGPGARPLLSDVELEALVGVAAEDATEAE